MHFKTIDISDNHSGVDRGHVHGGAGTTDNVQMCLSVPSAAYALVVDVSPSYMSGALLDAYMRLPHRCAPHNDKDGSFSVSLRGACAAAISCRY